MSKTTLFKGETTVQDVDISPYSKVTIISTGGSTDTVLSAGVDINDLVLLGLDINGGVGIETITHALGMLRVVPGTDAAITAIGDTKA